MVLIVFLLNATFQPLKGEGHGRVNVTIPKGASAEDVGDVLERKGVISSSRFFALNATVTARRGGMRSGPHVLKEDMSNGAAIEALRSAPPQRVVKTVRVVIPEGHSIAEVSSIVKRYNLKGDYAAAARDPLLVAHAKKLGLPTYKNSLEGLFFPATYDVEVGGDVKHLVKKQLTAFADNFRHIDLRDARRRKVSPYKVITVASMIERETSVDKERPLIAAVIYNRLKFLMPLGIDATTRYATGNWTKPLTKSDLARKDHYNTRNQRGLPPTPIGNPGLSSLKAAARPSGKRVLYFVVKPGTCDNHVFSENHEAHMQDVARYRQAWLNNGGKSPTNCKQGQQ
jgi:uncharacterized YceG family protein